MASSDGDPETGSGAPRTEPPFPRRPWGRGRALRIVLGVLASMGVLGALALGGLFWVLGHLAHPRVKAPIQELLRAQAGLEVDYASLEISPLRGIHGRGIRILQPARFRGVAQEFLRVDELEVQVRRDALVDAEGGLAVALLRVGKVDLTVVRDAAGATTLSELFPPEPERAPPERDEGLSHALRGLPRVRVAQLAVGPLRGRLIELRSGEPTRTSTLEGLALHGTLKLAPNDLRGTALSLAASPSLRLTVREGARSRGAELSVSAALGADRAGSLSLGARADLVSQSLVPSWTRAAELLRLDARIAMDERAGRTTITCSEARLVDGMLAARAALELFDGEPLRLSASGQGKLALARLPMEVEGVSLEALALDVDVKRLALHGDRVDGQVTFEGGVQRLSLVQGDERVELVGLRTAGDLSGPSGALGARAEIASLALRSPTETTSLAGARLALRGSTAQAASGVQSLEATLQAKLATAVLSSVRGQGLALSDLALEATTAASVPELRAGRLPRLESKLEIAAITARDATQRALVEHVSAALTGTGLARAEASPTGVEGMARASLSVPSLRLYEASRTRSRAQSARMAVERVSLAAELPLSLAEVAGKLSLGALSAGRDGLEKLQLDFALARPLAFTGSASPPASVRVSGEVGALHAGESRGALEGLKLAAERLPSGAYRVALEGDASSLVLDGARLPDRLRAELRGEADPHAGTVSLASTLHGARGAHVALGADAAFTRASGRLRYEATLAAKKLDAFAALLHGAVPGSAAVKVEGMRLHAKARGSFTGILRAPGAGLPEPTESPLASARGEQSLELSLDHLDYQDGEHALIVPALSLSLASEHGDQGGGTAKLRLRGDTLRYAGRGVSVHLERVDERLAARFERAPDRSLVDVHSTLALGTVTQSLFPEYRVADLALGAHVQIDRLRSIFLRELTLDNPAAGTSLRARGAIELRTPSTEGGRTIVEREALALEGSLEQALGPLAKLGFVSHARGALRVPFRLESGGLLGYRLLATLEAKDVSIATKDRALGVEGLNGVIPIVEEFALLPGGPVLSAGPRASPLTETRFFDVHPFLTGNDYLTAQSITLNGLSPLGPFAANVRLERSDFLIDQLQVGWSGGQIVGQVRVAYRAGDPLVRLRLNATGVRAGKSQDVLDANAALSFQPKVMTLDGKVQLVRASRAHLLAILDVVDPYHESVSASRVRQALALGYPKFVRFRLHDGAVDTKVELSGVAQVVRIDEIRAVPLGPILQRYVMPTLRGYLAPSDEASATPLAAAGGEEEETRE